MNRGKWSLAVALSVTLVCVVVSAGASEEGKYKKPAGAGFESLLRDAQDPSAKVRAAAVSKMSSHEDPRVVPTLITALHDGDRGVRFLASHALSRKGATAIPPLKALLASDKAEVRAAVVETLSNMQDPARLEPLIIALLDADESIARQAYAGLTRYEAEPSRKPLAPLLMVLDKGGVLARSSAAILLPDCQDANAVEPLLRVLQTDVAEVRPYAANAFTRIKDARTVEPLLAALNDENPLVRSQAALALGTQADARAVPPLLARLKDEDAEVRKSAVLALGKIGDRRAIDSLLPFLKDEQPPMRLLREAIAAIAGTSPAGSRVTDCDRFETSKWSARRSIAAVHSWARA